MLDEDLKPGLYNFPTELLLYIFTYLPAKQLTNARLVCARWKLVIDGLIHSDLFWRAQCRSDFPEVYSTARKKCRPGLLWYHIYRSLCLWPKLSEAREMQDEFSAASSVQEEIKNFKILRNGVIGVHKRTAIVYYDIDTMKPAKRGPITGDYLRYTENEDVIAILSFHLQLYVIRKVIQNPRYDSNITFDAVKNFLLLDHAIYYVTLNDDIYFCKLEEGHLQSDLLSHSDDGVMSFGFSNMKLHVLTFQRNIYSVDGRSLNFICTLGPNSNLLHQLRQYNFLSLLDWRIYFQWMYILNHNIPQGPLRDIVIVRAYGDVVFVGSNWGVLRIYYAPYSRGEFDLYNSEPIKQYNFMERYDCPVLSMCPIIQVDVMECEDGHTVIVAMPKKLAILNFVHHFKRTASVAILPYTEESVKMLRIDGSV